VVSHRQSAWLVQVGACAFGVLGPAGSGRFMLPGPRVWTEPPCAQAASAHVEPIEVPREPRSPHFCEEPLVWTRRARC
jgi:hypothetical protein